MQSAKRAAQNVLLMSPKEFLDLVLPQLPANTRYIPYVYSTAKDYFAVVPNVDIYCPAESFFVGLASYTTAVSSGVIGQANRCSFFLDGAIQSQLNVSDHGVRLFPGCGTSYSITDVPVMFNNLYFNHDNAVAYTLTFVGYRVILP